MTVDEAINLLQYIKSNADGSLKLKVYVQTGADSWEWRDIAYFEEAPHALGEIIVDVTLEDK